jgi:hypothetical protein
VTQVVETGRRVLLTGVLALIARGTAVQAVVGMVITMVFIRLYSVFGTYCSHTVVCIVTVFVPTSSTSVPYKHKDDEFVVEMCQYAIYFCLFGALLVQSDVVG